MLQNNRTKSKKVFLVGCFLSIGKLITFKPLNYKIMIDLFSNPTSKTKVRKGIFAYKYPNGCININGQKYFGYSIKNAVQLWRKSN